MSDTITLTGLVATVPRAITTQEGLAITSFRLASSQRRYDRTQEKWIEADTNWYTVTAFRHLAVNLASSIQKAQRVVVVGRLKIREWENGDRTGTTVEIEAEAVGHDLSWGTASFSRTSVSTPAASEGDAPSGGGAAAVSSSDAQEAWAGEPSHGAAADPAVLVPQGEHVETPF